MKNTFALSLAIFAGCAFAQPQPAKPRPAAATNAAPPSFHLQLEANPTAPFPFLSRFGKVDLHVYRSGVRAEALWLNSFSRNGDAAVTVMNPLGRMFVEMAISDIAPTIAKLAGGANQVERNARPTITARTKGKVVGIEATRHRLSYGPDAYIDYWTTTALPDNPHLRRITTELVRGISPGTADVAATISGVPLYVELNFRRFKKLPMVYVKKFTPSIPKGEEEDALKVGALYVRASVLEKLWEK